MKLVKVGALANMLALFTSIFMAARDVAQAGQNLRLTSESYLSLVGQIVIFQEIAASLGLAVCAGVAEELGRHFGQAKLDADGAEWSGLILTSIVTNLNTINLVLGRELSTKKFFVLTPGEADQFDAGENQWGQDFLDKFPKALYDLDEASKCLAFGRSTAAVFHLMRITEIGLEAVSLCLGVPSLLPEDRSWGAILKKVKGAIDAKGPHWLNKEAFNELYALLHSVKEAWRNNAIHVEKTYTPEWAEHITVVVRGFMKGLASRMDENGLPRAA